MTKKFCAHKRRIARLYEVEPSQYTEIMCDDIGLKYVVTDSYLEKIKERKQSFTNKWCWLCFWETIVTPIAIFVVWVLGVVKITIDIIFKILPYAIVVGIIMAVIWFMKQPVI